jgi:hypothetical protein
MTSSWVRRGVTFVLLFAIADVVFSLVGFAPDHLRLLLVMSLGFAVVVLLLDALNDDGPGWDDDPVRSMIVPGHDQRLAGYVRMLDSHLTARTPDAALRDRLRALCDERLARRRGLSRTDPAARELLGHDLLQDLADTPRRLSREQISRHLERIEKL